MRKIRNNFASLAIIGGLIASLNFVYAQIRLEPTGVSNGQAYLNLHNATNQVYAIWSTTNLLVGWNVETEVWPTNGVVMPFTVPTLDRQNLFLRAEDWTRVTENGNTAPDWWFWGYFGTIALSDTNLDSQGNTLLYDYQNGVDPNIISFLIQLTNNYVNTPNAPVQLNILGGVPSYVAVLVNDMNQADAVWQPYVSSNIVATLGSTNGTYGIFVGLRSLPPDAAQTWQWTSVTLYSEVLTLTITNPTTSTVSQSPIQLQGYASNPLDSLTFDVSNAAGIFTNQKGYLTEQFYDTNSQIFTTNYFQCYDIQLTSGLNTITLHATDLTGSSTTTNFSVTLDYSSDTTPPALAILWPQDGTAVSGNSFTLQAQVDDDTATVTAQIADSNGNTNTVQGLVERSGLVWVQNLPLVAGTNTLTVTATDAPGNSTTTNLTLIQSGVMVTMDPLNQFNQSSVTVTGTISDSSYDVWVNGVEAYYLDDEGDWEADGVPVSPTGTATFDVEIYFGDAPAMSRANLQFGPMDNPNGNSAGSQKFNQPQPATVLLSDFTQKSATDIFQDSTVQWNYVGGGNWSWTQGVAYPSGPIPPDGDGYTPPWVTDVMTFWGWASGTFAPTWHNANATYYRGYTFQTSVQTTVMIVPSGPKLSGVMKTYCVRASAMQVDPLIGDYSFFFPDLFGWVSQGNMPVPPEQLQVNGQTLVGSLTNDDGSIWGQTIISAPAGALVPLTMTTANPDYNDYTFNVLVIEIFSPMVDNKRDGQISLDGSDDTAQDKPFRFWINDSKEHGDDESAGGADDQIPGQSYFNANYSLKHVNGSSDLVNFFPVALCLSNVLQWLPPTNGFEYHLTQNDAGLPAGTGNGAVKFVYTSLSPTNAFDYLTNTAGFGYGTNSDEWVTNADTIQVRNTPGTVLDTNWLVQVQNNGGYGVILVEGCAAATQPLMLELWRNGQKVGGVPLYLSISGVEQMFRHANFSYVNGTVTVPARTSAPNEPLTNGKNLVFLHGYNVSQQEARGVESEMFKRFYWSGSKAKFYGITWNGAESKETIPFGNWFTPNYHTNVVNALDTASPFTNFLANLSGQTVVTAHSLGNMVVLSAISDYNAAPSKYFMIDCAAPMEALQGDMAYNPNMLYSTWNQYANRTFASDWWQLFTNGDARSTLTWSNRLDNLGSVDIYNFYSSGEEVLREYDSDPPSTLLSGSGTELKLHLWDGLPYGIYAWVWQEKGKGTCQQDWFLGSSHGGWRFPVNEYGDPNPVPPFTANNLPDSTLRQTPIFDFGSYFDSVSGPFPDLTLTNTDGTASTYAQANRDRILSDAIPALTLPVGANSVTRLDERAGGTRNFNMQTTFEADWPAERLLLPEGNNWHHSDFDYVAYPFTHRLFDTIVNDGNLK